MFDYFSKVIKPVLTIAACFQDTFKADTAIHFVLIFEAPMTTGVPILCEKFFPVIKELFTNLNKTLNWEDKNNTYLILLMRVGDLHMFSFGDDVAACFVIHRLCRFAWQPICSSVSCPSRRASTCRHYLRKVFIFVNPAFSFSRSSAPGTHLVIILVFGSSDKRGNVRHT